MHQSQRSTSWTQIDAAGGIRMDPPGRADRESGHRYVRMGADWWDAPPSARCLLDRGMRSARTARVLARSTLRSWSLMPLAEDAEIIVGELAANAVIHAAGSDRRGEHPELRLLCRTSQLICAVLDPADEAPMLKTPAGAGETGRGLQLVDALSDLWGWSPMPGHGKVVWAILFCG